MEKYEATLPSLRFCPGIYPEGLRNTAEYLSQNNHCTDWDSKRHVLTSSKALRREPPWSVGGLIDV